jgi:hypothetical protein
VRFLSCDDSQGQVGSEIEEKKDNLNQSQKRVDDHVEGFSGNGEPSALCAINEIQGEYGEHTPQSEDDSVDDCAPHKECRECLNIHDF